MFHPVRRVALAALLLLIAAVVPASSQAATSAWPYLNANQLKYMPPPALPAGGDRVPRPPTATTPGLVSSVEYAREYVGGREDGIPLSADLYADLSLVGSDTYRSAGLPAVLLLHGGLVKGACTGARRADMEKYADWLVRRGYIVFNVDFRRASNDVHRGAFASLLGVNTTGDCMPDDGWEPSAKRAQISAQLAARSLKWQLRGFAEANPTAPYAAAFAAASEKVVAMGVSTGGHLAARLALRSEDVSGESSDTVGSPSQPSWRQQRRISGAVALSSPGECVASNNVRNWDSIAGMPAFTAPQPAQPFATCGPVAPDPTTDAPMRFHSAISTIPYWPYTVIGSTLSGTQGWPGPSGTDSVVDAKWAWGTCQAFSTPGACASQTYKTVNVKAHQPFPFGTTNPGSPVTSTNNHAVRGDGVLPSSESFFRTVAPIDWY